MNCCIVRFKSILLIGFIVEFDGICGVGRCCVSVLCEVIVVGCLLLNVGKKGCYGDGRDSGD